jgi:hypothetical protein
MALAFPSFYATSLHKPAVTAVAERVRREMARRSPALSIGE